MKCDKCRKEYWTRECLNCKDNPNVGINNKSNKNIIFYIAAAISAVVIIIMFLNINTNPLIGEWKANQKSFMGMGKLKFTKTRMETMGIVSKVEYEVDGNEVIVTDETGTGMTFKIIDKDTIYHELMGIKMTYKRIK